MKIEIDLYQARKLYNDGGEGRNLVLKFFKEEDLKDKALSLPISWEDLAKIKKSTSRTKEGYKRAKHNNALSQIPFYMFKQIMTYKAPLYGKIVETVSPVYTSQMDYRTNNRDGVRRGRRYLCIDGVVFDADWNAAINIGQRSNHPVSSGAPLDGALTPLMGRSQSMDQSFRNR